MEVFSERNATIQIFNLNGIQMDKTSIEKGLNQIDVSNYPSGMYLLVSKSQAYKFMKF